MTIISIFKLLIVVCTVCFQLSHVFLCFCTLPSMALSSKQVTDGFSPKQDKKQPSETACLQQTARKSAAVGLRDAQLL